jgi:hypothetical protein
LQATNCSSFITWLFLERGGRIWIPRLIHAANNAFTSATPQSFSSGEILQVWAVVVLLAMLACAGIAR